ncbi:AAEL004470-PA [Aedes aegypti]|uniref:AAEL004470-PA n=1 Tax=Aedes aegypti TaxID=7159 RepID=Q17CN9_AEDAE|nr:AAEL004470-PA [Aedes aegypti]
MTSPKITADKTNANASQDATEAASNGNAAAGSSADSVAAASAENSPGTGPYGVFSWLKVFRFANLMIKQGC